MIHKYIYGTPFYTEAILADIEVTEGHPSYGTVTLDSGFLFTYRLGDKDMIFGLGENIRGINKRGYRYVSYCSDEPNHLEDKVSLYGAHNFIVISGEKTFGIFVDYPSRLEFDICYTRKDYLTISCEKADLDFYVIDGESPYDIVKQFRKIIGRSYIPPKFAFGYGQSRWEYKTQEDFTEVVRKHRENHIPIDMLYMDIDYMEEFKDFTVDPESFPDFQKFVDQMKADKIHLVPIIDAGVKIQKGYDVYEEGVEKGYFCKKADGTEFVGAVWPGLTHFPDFLNEEAREWFGEKYARLTDYGIDGFWNDMNEPAIFYTPEGLQRFKDYYEEALKDADVISDFSLQNQIMSLPNSPLDYDNFYHNVKGKKIRHSDVHNLYGYNMTRAAGEAFEKFCPDKRILMFSRASYIGMHRYGGIWMGDNKSWWSHLLMNLQMLPSLNMCGFLYTGADLCGFGSDATRDLVLRWLSLGVFTPLMRNHAAIGTRRQEVYQFEEIEDFKHVIGVRYRLVPYLYSEYMKAALGDDMMFKPLAFEYPDDARACKVEDQLMLGNEIMIAPVYTQNADGRYVYLPEEMMFVKFLPDGTIHTETLEKGHHFVEVALNEVPLFIRQGRCIPLADAVETVEQIDTDHLTMIGYPDATYERYDDDGISRIL